MSRLPRLIPGQPAHLKKMKAVHNYFETNTRIGLLAGMIGGMWKYIMLQVQVEGFGESAMKAAATALICGLAGVAGKEIYGFLKKHITVRFKRKIKQ